MMRILQRYYFNFNLKTRWPPVSNYRENVYFRLNAAQRSALVLRCGIATFVALKSSNTKLSERGKTSSL